MSSNQEARLNLVISARDEARTVVESMAKSMMETFKGVREDLIKAFDIPSNTFKSPISPATVEQVGEATKSIADDVKTIGTAATSSSDDFSAALKTITRSLSTLTKETTAQTKEIGLGIELIAQTTQDSSISITSEIDNVDRSIREMASTMSSSASEMTKHLQSLTQEFKTFSNDFKDSATQNTESGKKISKAIDTGSILIAGSMIQDWGRRTVDTFAGASLAAAGFNQDVMNTVASLNSNLPQSAALSTTQIHALNDAALQMGSQGFFSANQIAEAMNVLAKQGLSYQQIMGGAITTAHDVAAANQEDLDHTANVVSDIIHEMGGELIARYGSIGTAMQHVGNAMTSALHHARLSMDDFLNTMKYVGPQASNVGVSFEDLSASIAILGEHGIRGSQAGTSLRRMLTNLTPQSAKAAETMKELGMITKDGANIFYDSSGKMKPLIEVQQLLYDKVHALTPQMQQLALKTIFGQYALSGMTAIANTTPSAFQEMTSAMNKAGVTHDILTEKSKGWGFQLQQTQAHLQTFYKEIGSYLLPVLGKLLETVNSLINWFEHLPKPVQHISVMLGALTGVVALIGGGMMVAVANIGFLVEGLGALGVAAGAVTAPLLPIIAIIAAVIAVVIGLYEAWSHNFLGIRDITNSVWNGIKTAIQAVWGWLQPYITAGLTAVRNFWHQVWPELKQLFNEVWTAIKFIALPIMAALKTQITVDLAILKFAWELAWNGIKTTLKIIWDAIVLIIKVAWDVITGTFKVVLDLLTGNWSKAWTDMQDTSHKIWDAIKVFFKNIASDMYNFGQNMVKMFADGIMSAIHWVENAANTVISKVKGLLGFHSPTKEGPGSDADTWMPNMMNMFTDGIVKNTPHLTAAIGNVALGLKTNLTSVSQTTFTNVMPQQKALGQQPIVQIYVEGRSKRTDQEIVDEIAKKFRTQMSIVSA